MVLLIGLSCLLSLVGVIDSQTQLTTIQLFKAQRTWNDAVKFCSGKSMNLLEVRTEAKADALDWINTNTPVWQNKIQDSWIGLHDPDPSTKFGYSWAEGCTPHGQDGTSWSDWYTNEPLNYNSNKCVKIVRQGSGFAWRAESCSQKKMVFCESVGGDCIFHRQFPPAILSLFGTIPNPDILNLPACKSKCSLYKDASGECWGVTFDSSCTLHVGSSPIPLSRPLSFSDFYVKKCFVGDYDGTDDHNSPDTSSDPGMGCIAGQALVELATTTTTTITTTTTPTTTSTTTTPSTTSTTTTPTTTSTTTTPTTTTTTTTSTTTTPTTTSTTTTPTTTSTTTAPTTTTTPTTLTSVTTTPTTVTPVTTTGTSTTPVTTVAPTTATLVPASTPSPTSTPTTTATPTTATLVPASTPSPTSTSTVTSLTTTTTPTPTSTSAATAATSSVITSVVTNTPTPSTVAAGTSSVSQTAATTTTANGLTVNNTTQGVSASVVDAWSLLGYDICSCNCNSTDNKTLEEKIEEIVLFLTVDKSKTSKSIRKKISVQDNRPSAQNIGFLGIAVLVATGGLFLVADSTYIFQLFKFICGKKR